MAKRHLSLFLFSLMLLAPAFAKNKKLLPDEVLHAKTIMIMILPAPGTPVDEKDIQATQDGVRNAFAKWGRFASADGGTPDLLIVCRKGHAEAPTPNLPPPERIHPTTGRTIPDSDAPGMRGPDLERQPAMAKLLVEDDVFEVYPGGVDRPLEKAPLWLYKGKGVLQGSKVAAVERFRKAIEESERQRQ
jgi:hypothetical protein